MRKDPNRTPTRPCGDSKRNDTRPLALTSRKDGEEVRTGGLFVSWTCITRVAVF